MKRINFIWCVKRSTLEVIGLQHFSLHTLRSEHRPRSYRTFHGFIFNLLALNHTDQTLTCEMLRFVFVLFFRFIQFKYSADSNTSKSAETYCMCLTN